MSPEARGLGPTRVYGCTAFWQTLLLRLSIALWLLIFACVWLLARSYAEGNSSSEGPLAGAEVAVRAWPGQHHEPVVAYDSSADAYLLAWSFQPPSSTRSIYATRLSGAGEPSAESFLLAGGYGDRAGPALAYDASSGKVLACWHHDSSGSGTNWDVHCRFLPSGSGNPVEEFALADEADANEWRPAVVSGSSGTFLLAWNRSPKSGVETVAGVLLLSGEPTQLVPFSLPQAGLPQRHVALAYDTADGQCLLVWQRGQEGKDGVYDVYAGTLAEEGEARFSGNPVTLAASEGDEGRPAAGYIPGAGRYVVTWEAQYQPGSEDYDILAQILTPALEPLSGVLRVAFTPRPEVAPAVACSSALPQCLVVWQEELDGHGPLRGRHVYGDGTLSPSFTISESNDRSAAEPAVAAGEGHYLVAWASSAATSEEPDEIRARLVHSGYTFSGTVHHGHPGAPELPLEGVRLRLLGDLDGDPFGGEKATTLAEAVTAADGTFTLSWQPTTQHGYYHVVQVEQPGRVSVDVNLNSAFGTKSSPASVTYTHLAPGNYAGIEFYDLALELLPFQVFLPSVLAGN